jgi:hypothetical protein
LSKLSYQESSRFVLFPTDFVTVTAANSFPVLFTQAQRKKPAALHLRSGAILHINAVKHAHVGRECHPRGRKRTALCCKIRGLLTDVTQAGVLAPLYPSDIFPLKGENLSLPPSGGRVGRRKSVSAMAKGSTDVL